MLGYIYRLPPLYQEWKARMARRMIEAVVRRFQRDMAEWETLSEAQKQRRWQRAEAEDRMLRREFEPSLVRDVLLGLATIVLFGYAIVNCHFGLPANWTSELLDAFLRSVEALAVVGFSVALLAWLDGHIKLPGQP